jgi:hypothetical protein
MVRSGKDLQLAIAMVYDEISELKKERAVIRSNKRSFSQAVKTNKEFEPVIREAYMKEAEKLNKIERSSLNVKPKATSIASSFYEYFSKKGNYKKRKFGAKK